MICPKCGINNREKDQFCRGCGTVLGNTKQPAPPAIQSTSAQGIDWRDLTLGREGSRNVKLSSANRTQGIALIGKTGTGKSSLIRAMINQELQSPEATCILFDPHSDLARSLLRTGQERIEWVTPDPASPFGLNLLEANPDDYLAVERTVGVAIEIFKKIIGSDSAFMPRFEYIFGSIARTIIYSRENLTLAEVPLLLTDLQFSHNVARNLENPALRRFWDEYEKSFWDKSGRVAKPYDQYMYLESVSNRINTLLQNELLYRIVSQSQSTIRFKDLLESKQAIIVSLPMGRLGSGATSLLGSILLAKCAEAIYQRGANKHRVHLYIDEYGQYFSTPFTADLLTQGRKYNVSTLVTMQTLDQLPDEQNQAAVLNAGNLLVFSVIGKDADILSKQFALPDALPEKTDTLSPYIVSPTPVQDIWKKGHNSQAVMEIRDKLFILLHRLDTQPYEKVFICPEIHSNKGRELQNKFTDMEDYSTSREQAVEGFNKLNECLAGCQGATAGYNWQEWLSTLFTAFLLFRGYLGFYPQNYKDTEGEYAEYIEARARSRYPVDPRQLRDPYEWVPRSIPKSDVGCLYDLFAFRLGPEPDMETYQKLIQRYIDVRVAHLPRSPNTEVQMLNLKAMNYSLPSVEEKEKMYGSRIVWELMNLQTWSTRFSQAIPDLIEHPVMTQSSTYAGQRTDRTVGDMKEELSMRLATLPNYTALCNLLRDDGTHDLRNEVVEELSSGLMSESRVEPDV
jgi:hypothetical protein